MIACNNDAGGYTERHAIFQTHLNEPQGKLKMPKFVSAHVIACMTRQDVSRLLKRFKEEGNADVINIRVLCDTLSGRMVCEWEARDSVTLIEWLKKCNVQIRGTGEWLMAVQYESIDDELVVPPRHNT